MLKCPLQLYRNSRQFKETFFVFKKKLTNLVLKDLWKVKKSNSKLCLQQYVRKQNYNNKEVTDEMKK
jgi:hypothetical protein